MKTFAQLITEKKDHIINKLPGLSSEEKEELIAFFKNNPHAESQIDWNDKALTFDDFIPVMQHTSKTAKEKAVKLKGIAGLKEGTDYVVLKIKSDIYSAFIPLTWEASKFIASNKIGNCTGKWCISYQKDEQYWKTYVLVQRGVPVMLIDNRDGQKWTVMVQKNHYSIWDHEDKEYDDMKEIYVERDIINPNKEELQKIRDTYFKIECFVETAETMNAEYDFDHETNTVFWRDGIWKDGTWVGGFWDNGLWKTGKWEDGMWKKGTWKDGTWMRGTWRDGVWRGGEWFDGTWYKGTWHDGMWFDGMWLSGEWNKGMWNNGDWQRGIWRNGEWFSGNWYGGEWKKGVWWKGTWHEGSWENGTHHAGTWKDGTWLYGDWINGDWMDGVWYIGTWMGGIWHDGTWSGGTWKRGTWKDGTWMDGVWESGEWLSGKWLGGEWKGGDWQGGYDADNNFHKAGDSPNKW